MDHRCFKNPCLYCIVGCVYKKLHILVETIQRLDSENKKLISEKVEMDKKIRAIEKKVSKDAKSEKKSLKTLEKMDKKRDKVCSMGEKEMKKKGKK